jgi:diguanylate cyclase (GGDEF)-like protein
VKKIKFILNGTEITTHYPERVHGLDLLKNCGDRNAIAAPCSPLGTCGNCAILVNGHPTLACLTRPEDLARKDIETLGSAADACLIRYNGQHLGRRETVLRASMVIGRGESCELQLSSTAVSREHAKITKDLNGNFFLSDLGSTNGTFKNFKRISAPSPLHNGDMIRIGSILLKFYRNNNIESAIHDRMYRLAAFDELTRIYNRKFLLESLEIEISQAIKSAGKVSIVFIDLDYFKSVNDTFGHQAGDYVLREAAKVLKDKIRDFDILGRYGGEEFLVILPGADEENAIEVASRMRVAIETHPFLIDPQKSLEAATTTPVLIEHRQTISLGVAWLREGSATPDSILADADRSLYASKAAGRNTVVGIDEILSQKLRVLSNA